MLKDVYGVGTSFLAALDTPHTRDSSHHLADDTTGKTFANELYKRGARSIEDLKTHDYGLTAAQKVKSGAHAEKKTILIHSVRSESSFTMI